MTYKNISQEELIQTFNFFDNWLDKYQYIIDLGKKIQDFPEDYKIDEYKVTGCQSNVWIKPEYSKEDNLLKFEAISDSAIVSGLIYILLFIYNNKSPKEILETEPDFINSIGLDKHLSPTRKNGLFSMLNKIKDYAKGYSL